MAPLRFRTFDAALITRTLGIILIVGLLLGYGVFQARFFLAGPVITLESPLATLQENQTVLVAGTAKNITEISINGRQIHTDAEGLFEESLVLPSGYTIMTVHAKDRYGRTVSVTKELIYKPNS